MDEPGSSNQLQFDGIFKGKESEIRITPDKMISVFDFIRLVGGQKNPKQTWENINKKYKEEVVHFLDYFKFQGPGQKLTPVINVKGMVKLLFWLPGEMAKQFRSKSAETMIRYLGGDLTLIDEIKQIDNHHVANPNNVAQIFREEVQQNQILFSQDEINNSRRLLEHFGSMNNIFYMLAFKHQEEKTGVVRDSRQLHTRYGEHQSEFGEVCLHLAIQCSDINTVETEFKQTSFFRTNKVSNIPRKRGGFHTEILKLSELVTTETIKEKMKLVAGDRITDPPPVYTQETTSSSLEIEKERTRQKEQDTKQVLEQEKTKQMEIQLRLAEIQANKEIRLAEIKQTIIDPQPVLEQEQTTQENTIKNRYTPSEQECTKVKIFMENYSYKTMDCRDSIFLDDLYNKFEEIDNTISRPRFGTILNKYFTIKRVRTAVKSNTSNRFLRSIAIVKRKMK